MTPRRKEQAMTMRGIGWATAGLRAIAACGPRGERQSPAADTATTSSGTGTMGSGTGTTGAATSGTGTTGSSAGGTGTTSPTGAAGTMGDTTHVGRDTARR
jgi:hypothetical protein